MKSSITITALTSMALGVFTSSCGPRHESGSESLSPETSALHEATLPPQFAFIQTNLDVITLEEVTNKIGPYSRVGHLSRDSPELTYEFDLPDHAALLVSLERPFDSRNRVHRVRFLLSTNDFHLFP